MGVSPDSVSSHKNFQKKHSLNFILISDPEHTLAEAFQVWKKNLCMAKNIWELSARLLLSKAERSQKSGAKLV